MSDYNDFFKKAKSKKQSSEKPLKKLSKNNQVAPKEKPKTSNKSFLEYFELGQQSRLLGALSVGFVIAVSGFLYPDFYSGFFKVKVGLPVGAQAAEEKPAPVQEKSAAKTKAAGRKASEEKISVLRKLEKREKELEIRESRLKRWEEELQKQEGIIDKKMAELEGLREKISKRLSDRANVDEERIGKLVEFYSNMKPQNAAKVFEKINEDLAVSVLVRMKKSNAAAIMNLLPADKATKLSEKFAGFKVAAEGS